MRALVLLLPLCLFAVSTFAQDLPNIVDGELRGLVTTYKSIHSHPELSHHEERTAAILADALRRDGYAVTVRVGKYPDGSQAYGVVGITEERTWPAVADSGGHGCIAGDGGDRRKLCKP